MYLIIMFVPIIYNWDKQNIITDKSRDFLICNQTF